MRHAIPLLLSTLTACTIYTPLQPPAPDIQAKGQMQAGLGVRMSTHVEGSAVYAPLNHVMVRVAGGGTPLPASGPTLKFASGQIEGGLGTYWPLGQHWLAGGLGGLAAGRSRLHYPQSAELEDYRARFRRSYGEVYLHHYISPYVALGTSYRLNQVRYSTFTNAGLPTTVRSVVRSEPLLFVRAGDDLRTEAGAIQAQLSVGLSMAHGPRERLMDDIILDLPMHRAKFSTFYTTLSVVIRPHLLRRKAQ
ncbi:hypothetical protein EJV47_09305 [Hymenobacter gummosus]|uniref:DUF3575 domain-containing protein n=1 Tax=Hymenobacter gummosus TaxID=1776032 RepID=A0A431U4E8_9BACT|nr:hypothetical protein [Hymenobacter gummosus]RTQ50807.1 hypothetical protein EJV47_09305 [Hymenobacter gummosus]